MNGALLLALVAVAILAVGYLLVTQIKRLSLLNLIVLVLGAIVGLIIGALLAGPLGKLPGVLGNVLPLAVSLLITVVTIALFLNRVNSIAHVLPFLRKFGHAQDSSDEAKTISSKPVLVDTSVIIDGRIADIARAGFVPGRLMVTRFVLAELQNIADSDDAMRRGRGRRGLEMLNQMRQTTGVDVAIINDDIAEIREVDSKLVHLAKRLGANILTTDYNLNRVAQIEGVRVFNINELANAIRPVVLPGEELSVKIVQAGKERGQGVGYLPDGTMIVVDSGDKLIGQEVTTEVTRVFQTVAGKMIFAMPKKSNGKASSHHRPRHQRNDRHHNNQNRHAETPSSQPNSI